MTDIISKTASILFFLVAICVVSSSSSSSSDCAIDSSTVCKFANQSLACCHAKDATCCESGEYCCPRGFQCDVANGRCVQDDMYIPFYLKLDLLVEHPLGKDILCPDNVTTCKEKQTCCNMTAGGYGCCPIRDAHCCEDGVHCCPKNYKCNPSQGKCDRNKTMHDAVADLFSPNSIDWLKKELGSRASVPCPGGTAECPTGSTCCQLNSGQWGCCPLPNAVCCDDHIHCCPNGYVCDVKDGRCNKQNEFVEMVKKMPAYHKPAPAPPKDDHIAGLGDYSVQCPDGCSFCPNGNTCCKMSDGSYGCCPLPKAVCCEDHLHCCPQNTRCNMAQQTCESTESNYTSTWLKKVPAKSRLDDTQVKTLQTDPVLCGDGKTECDPLKVCCKLPDNTFGCCPYVDGICCPGEAYCCPNDMICGNSTGECIPKPDESTTVTKFTNVVKNTAVSACQLDPSSEPTQQQCSSNSTACKNLNDQVVCCMYANGVCCGKDGLCCPNGYTCDEANEACQLNDDVVREPVQLLLADECDDVTAGAATTPCQTGCCASQNAVCCSDGLNCCPNGYSCSTSNDDSSLKCVKN